MEFVVKLVDVAFEVYAILILVRVVLSWIRHNPYHSVIRFIYDMTDPYLNIFRRLIPPVGVVDFSPVVAFFVLELIRALVLRLLVGLIGLF
ncbi:YggT family protein [Thermodesulfitimonas sp.]